LKHAYWNAERGPNNTPGEALHIIQDKSEWRDNLLKSIKDDPARIARINQMYSKGGYFTPQIGWFMSRDEYEIGRSGFGGVAKDSILNRYPGLQIHESLKDAAKAAGFE
jgi:hypothetical protein